VHTSQQSSKSSSRVPTGRPAILDGGATFDEEIFVTRPVIPDSAAFSEMAESIFESRWLTNNGPQAIELERLLVDRLGVAFVATFCNGTAALLTALRALDLEGEVITTPFTFPATAHCIEWNGLSPVFCDVDPETYNLDPASIEQHIGPRTSAILPVHVFGNPCDVKALQAIADRHGLKIIYDAAHCFGVTLDDVPIGAFGDLSALSFHATKVFHTAEGGAVVSADPRLCEKLALLRNFGIVNENEVSGVGLNGKLSELHAALGILVLDQIDAEIASRARLEAQYHERLQQVDGLSFQRFADGVGRNHFNSSIEIDAPTFGLSRDQVQEALRAEGIISRKYFHPLCSENECYADLPSARPQALPVAQRLASRILTLPLYGTLGEGDVDAIVDALLRIHDHAPAVRQRLDATA
jgi:dTDP-4-amino-4,6-dideoxygalactose transaminase